MCLTVCPASDGGQEHLGACRLSGLWELLSFCWPDAPSFVARRIFLLLRGLSYSMYLVLALKGVEKYTKLESRGLLLCAKSISAFS